MANQKKDNSMDLDLDSILSEINSNIQKEVSKKLPEEASEKASAKKTASPAKQAASQEKTSPKPKEVEEKEPPKVSKEPEQKKASKPVKAEKAPEPKVEAVQEAVSLNKEAPKKQEHKGEPKVEPKAEAPKEGAQPSKARSAEQKRKDKKKERKAVKEGQVKAVENPKADLPDEDAVVSFAHKAKIIEKEPVIEGTQHPVRFIAVTASEVVEEPKKSIKVISEEDTIDLEKAKAKETAKAEISRENNRHIKKLRRKQQKPKKTRRQKMTALLGLIMTLFIVVGVISTVWVSVDFAGELINNTNKKNELAQEIFPFVIVDIPAFTDPTKLDNSAVIASAIWDFVINEPDKSKYTVDELGSMDVPAVDIEHYIRRLYGNDIEIVHQSVEDSSIMMTYIPDRQMYNIESTPKFLPYTPRVDKITRTGDLYTLNVSYILPDVMWNLKVDKRNQQVDKKMEYVLKKNRNGYQVLSVKLLEVTGLTSSTAQMPTSDGALEEESSEEMIPVSATEPTTSGEAADTEGNAEGNDTTASAEE